MNALNSSSQVVKRLCLIGAIATCSSLSVFAQKDYIVTLQQDTLRGKINSFSDNVLKFRQMDSSSNVKFQLDQLKSVYYHKSKSEYFPVRVPGEKKDLFLKRVESGKIQIYELLRTVYMYSQYGGSSSSTRTWYAVKGDAAAVEIKTNKILSGSRKERKDAFYNLIKDDAALAKQFMDVDEFSFDFLQATVKRYNSREGKSL